MKSESLKADAAARLTRSVVDRFNWDREEQREEAYRELLPVVRDGLDEFERRLELLRRRLRPLSDAPEP